MNSYGNTTEVIDNFDSIHFNFLPSQDRKNSTEDMDYKELYGEIDQVMEKLNGKTSKFLY